jgi:hypothetical protein
MTSKLYKCFLFLTASLSTQAVAQELPQLPEAEGVRTQVPLPPSPALDGDAAALLMAEFGINAREAQRRVDLEPEILAFANQFSAETDPTFGGVYVQHEPVYKVVVAFTDNNDAALARKQIPPQLRRYLKVKYVPRSRAARMTEQDRFMTQINALNLDVASYIDTQTDDLVVITEDVAKLEAAFEESGVARPESLKLERRKPAQLTQATTPSGSYPTSPGDFIEGGRYYYDDTYQLHIGCTIGFGARLGSTYGFLTAGHCEPGRPGTGYWYWFNRWIELHAPTYETQAFGNKYDFQFHPTPGMKVYNTIYIQNNTAGSPFYLHVNGIQATSSQPANTTICKYGRETSHGCYRITSDRYSYKGASGWRYVVVNPASDHIVTGGDSGGPVYTPPQNGYVKAAGIITAGDHYNLQNFADMVYMPIEYIDDVRPITVLTLPSP